mgnify:CR=1 FL=1
MDPILNPTVFVGNFEWREPVTTLTDFLVAIVCWTGYYFFSKERGNTSTSYPWFKKYFLIFAIGMTSAAWLGHGLQAYVSPTFKIIGWACGATGLMFLQVGSLRLIEKKLSHRAKTLLPKWFNLQWILAVSLMFYFLSQGIETAFKVTQINSVVALWGFVLPMHLYGYYKLENKASKIVIIALLYSVIPGVVYSTQLSISNWFNYHDISHVLMAIFMTLMFLGLYQLTKRTNTYE